MSLPLNESLVLAKTRCQDLHSVYKLNCWGSGIKDVSLVRKLVNVEVIGMSCNEITTLEDFAHCPKLKELILRKNNIDNIAEIAHLQGLTKLTSLWLGENPCADNTYNYRKVVLKALPNLTVLDNIPVTPEELQEIEDLGNEIYEEIPYESSHSSGSGQSSSANANGASTPNKPSRTRQEQSSESYENNNNYPMSQYQQEEFSQNECPNDLNFQPTNEVGDCSLGLAGCGQPANMSDSRFSNQMSTKTPQRPQSRASIIRTDQCRSLTSQDSTTSLNCTQNQMWSMSNLNNNIFLAKGGRIRNSNILSAILCLIKELDYSGCEVVQTALHCRMEEASQ